MHLERHDVSICVVLATIFLNEHGSSVNDKFRCELSRRLLIQTAFNYLKKTWYRLLFYLQSLRLSLHNPLQINILFISSLNRSLFFLFINSRSSLIDLIKEPNFFLTYYRKSSFQSKARTNLKSQHGQRIFLLKSILRTRSFRTRLFGKA